MATFLYNSSIGKKLVMSVTGVFLVLFILFHMSMNIAALFSADAYNMFARFLALRGMLLPERLFWLPVWLSTLSTRLFLPFRTARPEAMCVMP